MSTIFSPFERFSESPQAQEAAGQLADRHAILHRLEAAGLDTSTITDGCDDRFLRHVADHLDSGAQAFAEGDDDDGEPLSDDEVADIDEALKQHGVADHELADMPLDDKVGKLLELLGDPAGGEQFADDSDATYDGKIYGDDPAGHDPSVRDLLTGYGCAPHELDKMSEDKRADVLLQFIDSDVGDGISHFSEVTCPELRQIGRHWDMFAEKFMTQHTPREKLVHCYIVARKKDPGLTAKAFLSGN